MKGVVDVVRSKQNLFVAIGPAVQPPHVLSPSSTCAESSLHMC